MVVVVGRGNNKAVASVRAPLPGISSRALGDRGAASRSPVADTRAAKVADETWHTVTHSNLYTFN